jgi:CoA binding domain
MPTIKQAAAEFLTNQRIAVTGVSRNPKSHGSNVVYQRLRDRVYAVFAVNPNANTVEGDPCYKDLRSIPGGVQTVVIGTGPSWLRTPCTSAPSSASSTCGCIGVPAPAASRRRPPTMAADTASPSSMAAVR